MRAILYDQTPLHRDNFLKLTGRHFYDSLLFHRVIPQFMIQGGDPTSRHAAAGTELGSGGDGLGRIPAEFRPELFHRRGALAAARDNNPQKASSGCQFYIVQGKPWTDEDLDKQQKRAGRPLTDAQRAIYRTEGGSPHLDGNYTVFGQVISGLNVIDSIAARPRDARNRPFRDIAMHITSERLSKKKISKRYGYHF